MVCLYSTLRVVKIPSRCLGITYFIIVVAVLGYIGGYGLAYSKGYQVSCPAQSVVVTKVKGTLSTSKVTSAELKVANHEFYQRIWDAPDIVSADSGENGGFFIMTNIIITPNQTRSTCPESPKVENAKCKTHRECPLAGKSFKNGNGVATGRCAGATCEIEAWCPVEEDRAPFGGTKALLLDTKEFTVLVKNTIEFPAFGPAYRRRNIIDQSTEDYLKNCVYNKKSDPYCPTFRIGSIVEGAGYVYDQVALTGAIFLINIKWDCSFDWGATIKHCLPKYSFTRLDDAKAKISPGFNFRTAVYHEENRRTLTQKYGLRFLIEVEGEGKMFDSLRFLLTVGASLGFFALASIICDFALDMFCKLQQYSNVAWLSYFSEDMKYDLEHVRQYDRAKYDRRGAPKQKEEIGLHDPC